jgi:hypothetical protein
MVGGVVEQLPNKYEALSSNPSATRERKRDREKEREWKFC